MPDPEIKERKTEPISKPKVEPPVSETYPRDINWFLEKGLPVRSIMPKEYYDEKKAQSKPQKPK